MTKIGKNLYHVVTPKITFTFTTRAEAREYAKSWAPSEILTFTTPLTPFQQIKAAGILEVL